MASALRDSLLVLSLGLLGQGCDERATAEERRTPPTPVAAVDQPVKEADLTTVKLSAAAAARLKITEHLAVVERRVVPRSRLYSGALAVPTGRALSLAAPVAGEVLAPAHGEFAVPGQRVKGGAPLLSLLPIVAPLDALRLGDALAAATGDLAAAEARDEAAGLAQKRAENLVRDGAGSKRALEEAQAQADAARAILDASRARLDLTRSAASLLTGPQKEGATLTSVAIAIHAPMDVHVRAVHAAPGAKVPMGAPLIDLEALNPLWVRVSVPAAELTAIDLDGACRVASLGAAPEAAGREAAPVRPAPPITSLDVGAVELSYVLENPSGVDRPGERVTARIPLRGSGEPRLVVPWAAVLHDLHGGTWIYEQTAPCTYTRRRITVERVAGDVAVLERALELAPGAKIVTAGAAELFGVEFGGGK